MVRRTHSRSRRDTAIVPRRQARIVRPSRSIAQPSSGWKKMPIIPPMVSSVAMVCVGWWKYGDQHPRREGKKELFPRAIQDCKQVVEPVFAVNLEKMGGGLGFFHSMADKQSAASPKAMAAIRNVWLKVSPIYLKPRNTRKLPRIAAKFLIEFSCPSRRPVLPSEASSIPMVDETGRNRCCPRL